MRSIQIVMNEMNFYNELFGSPLLELPLSIKDIEAIARKIDCDLSPENLTCDGEASPRHIAQRVKILTEAQGELALMLRGHE